VCLNSDKKIAVVLLAKRVSKFEGFTTVCLCLDCEIALYGVSVLYCDMQVLCVGLVNVVLFT